MIYEFFWGYHQLVKIDSSSAEATEPEVIKDLLDEYKKLVKDYNIDGWCSFLGGKGYKVEKIDYDYRLEF